MASDSKKILITGAAGLLGRELCRQLSKNNEVIAVDNNQRFPDYIPNDCVYIKSNLIEYLNQTKNNFDLIYHMAATNGTTSFYKNPNQVLRNNTELDLRIFEFVELNVNCKLIYASSSEVIAGSNNFPTTEEVDINIKNLHNPRWSYRIPKILSENYLFNSNINFLIIRFFNVYSEYSGSGHFLRDIVDKIKENKFDLIGSDETRCFCYVTDAIDALINVSYLNRIVINIGSDEEIKIEHAANIIANSLDKKSILWNKLPSLSGSSAYRKPDISKLKQVYPAFNPKSFEKIIETIKDRL